MNLKSACCAAVLVSLAACGARDPETAAFVAACVAGGDTDAYCTCQGAALRTELEPAVFSALLEFSEAMAEAGSETQGMIAMGALTNPKLVAALDKAEAAGRSCRQAAALELAKSEVAALEVARDQRREQAAARQCPHRPAMSPRFPDAPVDDVADLRPGMSFDDVVAVLECRGDVLNFATAREWVRKSPAVATRQLLRVADGDICPPESRLAGDQACEDGGWGFERLQNVGEEFIVAFTGLPSAERAGIIWRRTAFPSDGYPTVTAVAQALIEKYGPPHLQMSEEGYFSLGHPRGSLVYSWVYTPTGAPVAGDDSALLARCVNGPRPRFQPQMSWNSACGLTIRAELLTAPANSALARELRVVVMDQKRFDTAARQFESDLTAQIEALHQGRGAVPEL